MAQSSDALLSHPKIENSREASKTVDSCSTFSSDIVIDVFLSLEAIKQSNSNKKMMNYQNPTMIRISLKNIFNVPISGSAS